MVSDMNGSSAEYTPQQVIEVGPDFTITNNWCFSTGPAPDTDARRDPGSAPNSAGGTLRAQRPVGRFISAGADATWTGNSFYESGPSLGISNPRGTATWTLGEFIAVSLAASALLVIFAMVVWTVERSLGPIAGIFAAVAALAVFAALVLDLLRG